MMKYILREPLPVIPLIKAGPFVGPRGGLWADPKHTIHWDPKVHGPAQLGLFSAKSSPGERMKEAHSKADKMIAQMKGERTKGIEAAKKATELSISDHEEKAKLYDKAADHLVEAQRLAKEIGNVKMIESSGKAAEKFRAFAKHLREKHEERVRAYREKQEAKKERKTERAEKKRTEANAAFRAADLREEASGIPMGQPILVGHHSEKRHRKAIERANRALGRGIEAEREAKRLESQLAHPSTAVSSDDPEAIQKLKAKIEAEEKKRDEYKKLNKLIRKKGMTPEKLATEAGIGLDTATKLMEPDFTGDVGIPSYRLTNMGANIRRMKQRIEALRKEAERESTAPVRGEGFRIEEDPEDNRIRFYFDEKPSREVTQKMKRAGFRWSPIAGAWQRQLNNAGRYAAKQMASVLSSEEVEKGECLFIVPLKKAGPYIGPRGGKWADPKHTIPWKPEAIPGKGKEPEQWGKLPAGKTAKEHVQITRAFLRKHEAALPKAKAEIAELAGKGAEVKGRVKKLESALGKLVRKPKYKTADNLQDGTGIRVVHKTIKEVQATVAAIKAKYKVIEEDDYITKPQGNYRSHHLIIEGPGGLAMELQVRTGNQNVFADWAHDVYKPVTAEQAKYRESPEVQSYEKGMSEFMWAADNERDPPPPPRPPCTKIIHEAFGCL